MTISLSSLKLAPQRRGLCIPPGAAVSQSSEIFAQGQVSSVPRKAEAPEQELSEQTAQEHGKCRETKQESTSTNNTEGTSPSGEDIATTSSAPGPERRSMDSDRGAERIVSLAEGEDKQQHSAPASVKVQSSKSDSALELIDSLGPAPAPAPTLVADSAQPPASKAVLKGDSEALASGHPSPEDVQASWLHLSGTNSVESDVAQEPARNSSMTAPIPTIRVHQTTESEETTAPSGDAHSKHPENKTSAALESVPEAPTERSQMSTAGFSGSHSQPDIAASDSAPSIASPAENVSELAASDSRHAITPSVDEVKGGADNDYPGFTKLAVRKARNLAANTFVLSILLGRELAEQTKPKLEGLAKPPLRRSARTGPVPGPSQVDGIAEFEGEQDLSRGE